MGEPVRHDRKAADGKFCIWIEATDGSEHRAPDDFDTKDEAIEAAQLLIKGQEAVISRVLVYDGMGFFAYKLARRA